MNNDDALNVIFGAAIAFRTLLRKLGQYEDADKIREALLVFGIPVEDKK